MIDPVCASVVAALEDDPFYRCITAGHADDTAARRAALAQYFDYSIRQGERIGRVVRPADARAGVAVWTLPQTGPIRERESLQKQTFLRAVLGETGCADHRRIVDYMSERAAALVGSDSWYLSIVAVAPEVQGRGFGAGLLTPTLAQADAAGARCYLETFSPATHGFYARFGFLITAEFDEPTTRARYALLVRDAQPAKRVGR